MKAASVIIRLCSNDEFAAVQAIRVECAADLLNRFGAGHWSWTPTLESWQKETKSKNYYVASQGGQIVGALAVSLVPPAFFDRKRFGHPDDPAAYLSGLAVLPKWQKQGIGKCCMEQAEIIADELGCLALRFDAYDHAAGAISFYKKLGYQSRGGLIVRNTPLIFFEKILKR